MHSLEVIVARNERAAAREEAHARNDNNTKLEQAIRDAEGEVSMDYAIAYQRGREEN